MKGVITSILAVLQATAPYRIAIHKEGSKNIVILNIDVYVPPKRITDTTSNLG